MTVSVSLRWVGAIVLLTAEVLWLTATFRAPDASAAPEWEWLLVVFNEGHHYTAAVIYAAAFLLVGSASAASVVSILRCQDGYQWWPWAVLHASALLAFVRLTSVGFGASDSHPSLSLNWLLGWTAAGATTLSSWLLIIAPAKPWARVLRRQWINLAIAAVAGTAVWLGGTFVQNLWEPLAAGTMRLSALLLSAIFPEILYDPALGLIGTGAFIVEIYPVCSGYEGIALVAVFVATYLWIFRKDLPFPQAFVLFPVGIICIWLANVLRVTALIVIGTSVSPEIASRGFHSQAGWIAFAAVTLGLIALSHRWLVSSSVEGRSADAPASAPELTLLVPLLVLMATTMIAAAASAGFDALYPLGVVLTGAVLWHYRAAYRPMFGPLTWEPFLIGTAVFLMWALLVPGSSDQGQILAERLSDLPAWLAAAWLLFRVLGTVVTVPLAEELAFRGYLIRKLVSKDFERVPVGRFTWFSFLTSSLLFGFLHQHLLAGAIAGAAFALALYRRARVGDAILAHMTSNALIAAAVLFAGRWGYWT